MKKKKKKKKKKKNKKKKTLPLVGLIRAVTSSVVACADRMPLRLLLL